MVKLTRNGVCYDLRNTPYIHTVQYEDYKIVFHFSSELNRKRFEERILDNRVTINTSLTNRFNMAVKLNKLADVDLYNKVEKRGFYIVANGRIVEWVEEIIIGQERVTRAD